MPDPVLLARDFTYTYADAARPALRDISLEIEPGSFTVVAGESGSGKSTLLRAACGLVPHFHGGVVSGGFEVAGLSVRDVGPSELAAVCGTVFQDPESQLSPKRARPFLGIGDQRRLGEVDAGPRLRCSEPGPAGIARGGKVQVFGPDELRQPLDSRDCVRTGRRYLTY